MSYGNGKNALDVKKVSKIQVSSSQIQAKFMGNGGMQDKIGSHFSGNVSMIYRNINEEELIRMSEYQIGFSSLLSVIYVAKWL